MKTISATEASRGFSDLLDAIERGETISITRAGRRVAEIRPAPGRTGADLIAALTEIPQLDDDFESDIAKTLALLTEPEDRWADDS